MKKLFAIVFAAAIILGALAAFSASADEVSDFQPFEGITVIETERDFVNGLPKDTLPLDDATRLKIAEDYKTVYDYNCDPADCEVYHYKTLSNGMMLIFVEPEGIGYADVMGAEIIGKYVYVSTAAHKTVKLYKDGKFTEIGVAYKSGAIDDALLDEINEVMQFDTYRSNLMSATYDSPATPDSGELDDYEHDIWFPTDAEGVRAYWLDWIKKCKDEDADIIDNLINIVLIDEQVDKAGGLTTDSFPGLGVTKVFWNKYISENTKGVYPFAPKGSRVTSVELTLDRHDKNNVFRVIEELNGRDDIYLALCDFEWHADGATYDSPATPDIPYTGGGNTGGNNANGFIATGDSGVLVTVCVAAMAAAIGAIVIFKRKGKNINK